MGRPFAPGSGTQGKPSATDRSVARQWQSIEDRVAFVLKVQRTVLVNPYGESGILLQRIGTEIVSAQLGIGDQPLKQIVDRKSTRLNSSHSQISYAVFCLKKKKKKK